MCIIIFILCFDIFEFLKNKKNYIFFLIVFNMLMEFWNFKKNYVFLEMIVMVYFGYNYSIFNIN